MISDLRAYHALISQEVLTKVHHFQHPTDIAVSSDRSSCFSQDALKCARSKVWQKLFGIKGFGQPKWYSPGGTATNAVYGEFLTMKALQGIRGSRLEHMNVFSGLLSGPGLIVRCKVFGAAFPPGWYFVLGSLSEGCYLGWRAKQTKFAGENNFYYECDLRDGASCAPLHIHDWRGWGWLYIPVG